MSKELLEPAKLSPEHLERVRKMTLNEKIWWVMNDIAYIQKDTKVSAGKSGYTALSHDAVVNKLRPFLLKWGLIATPRILRWDTKEVVTTGQFSKTVFWSDCMVEISLRHGLTDRDISEEIIVDGIGSGVDSQDKAPGKSHSYAVKYALLKAFHIESGDHEEDRMPGAMFELPTPPAKPKAKTPGKGERTPPSSLEEQRERLEMVRMVQDNDVRFFDEEDPANTFNYYTIEYGSQRGKRINDESISGKFLYNHLQKYEAQLSTGAQKAIRNRISVLRDAYVAKRESHDEKANN